MKQTATSGADSTKKLTAAFIAAVLLSLAAYIAYAVIGLHFYRKLGRYPSMIEYFSYLLHFHEPHTTILNPREYLSNPQCIIYLLIGIRLMPVGYRYLLETGDKKPFAIYAAFTASDLMNTLCAMDWVRHMIPGRLRIALPFLVMASAVLTFAASVRLFMSARRGQLIVSLIPDMVRLLILPIIMKIITTGVMNILGSVFVLLLAGFILTSLLQGSEGSAPSGAPAGPAPSKAASSIQSRMAQKIDSHSKKIHALHEHDRGEIGYGYIDRNAQLRAIRNDELEIERLRKQYDKLK